MITQRFALVALLGALAGSPVAETPDASVPAQDPVIVTGIITDAGTGRPLNGVQVSVENQGIGALTNHLGVYVLNIRTAWAGREITVVAEMIGYEAARQILRLGLGTTTLNFALDASILALEELVVTGRVRRPGLFRNHRQRRRPPCRRSRTFGCHSSRPLPSQRSLPTRICRQRTLAPCRCC